MSIIQITAANLLKIANTLQQLGIHQWHLDRGGKSVGLAGNKRKLMNLFNFSTRFLNWSTLTLQEYVLALYNLHI